jgi:hypothetical protein
MRHPRAAGDPAVIDTGPAMVQVARRNVADGTPRFQVCIFDADCHFPLTSPLADVS